MGADTPKLSYGEIHALYELARELLRLDDYDELLDVLVQRSLSILNGERGFLVLRRRGRLDYKVVRNWSRSELEGEGEPVSRTIVHDVLDRDEPVLVEDAASNPRFAEMESVLRHHIRSVLAAPLQLEAEPVGVLYLESHRLDRLFGHRELEIFRRILELSARALKTCTRLIWLEERNRLLERDSLARHSFPNILTRDPVLLGMLETVARVAGTEETVLLQGPSGTGKELVARSLHHISQRSKKPFVPVNCSSFTPELVESELFGHLRGAFTGASRSKRGLIRAAEGGILFLDEIGELPLPIQAKLLRTLQFGEVRPVGSAEPVNVDVRFVAATNRDLRGEVAAKHFREDLFFRLSVVTLDLPPLAERSGDVLLLFSEFLHRMARDAERPVPEIMPDLEAALQEYRWPGNVRELENEVRRLLAVTPEGIPLTAQSLSPHITAPRPAQAASLAEQEIELIKRHLSQVGGNKTGAGHGKGVG